MGPETVPEVGAQVCGCVGVWVWCGCVQVLRLNEHRHIHVNGTRCLLCAKVNKNLTETVGRGRGGAGLCGRVWVGLG